MLVDIVKNTCCRTRETHNNNIEYDLNENDTIVVTTELVLQSLTEQHMALDCVI